MSDDDKKLLNELKRWRFETAKSLSIPPYCILHDRSLYEIIHQKPHFEKELKKIYGVGKKKVEKYGSDIISIITSE